jgi:hypothetical protein
MNRRSTKQLEDAVELDADGVRVRVGLRVVSGELLAGGPVELEFFIESGGLHPLHFAVSGDRTRQRPGQFAFSATFAGAPLNDPMAAMPYMGGPVGVVTMSTTSPWRQPLLLNQFIRLEETPGRIVQGTSGRMELACRRPLALATTEAAALAQDGALVVAVNLAFDLRRDDAALRALAARLLAEVMQGPLATREQPLARLLAMRSPARDQIDALTRYPDPSVADRARQALALSV